MFAFSLVLNFPPITTKKNVTVALLILPIVVTFYRDRTNLPVFNDKLTCRD